MSATRPILARPAHPAERPLARAFFRAAGAPLIAGNHVRLLADARENYPAWFKAIAQAKRTIRCESYIIHDDDIGRRFAEALTQKARSGVHVQVIYDWMGAFGARSWGLWKPLREAGVEVRCFNPPRFGSKFSWLSRDHRKMLSVDGETGFITGLCVGRPWLGNPETGMTPWRDTGVEIHGPAVAQIEQAFAEMWSALGPPMAPSAASDHPGFSDGVGLRIVASSPYTAGLYRFDLLLAGIARSSIWLTDAYYLGTTPYVQALGSAARDGVDVRLLVPRSTDIPILRTFSRNGYSALLEAGVRVFEWNGSMLHAKTAVVDGEWARVGSTNLNPASWIGNWELDVIVEDKIFARNMEELFLQDLSKSTELVLRNSSVRRSAKIMKSLRNRVGEGSGGRAVTGLLKMSSAVHDSVIRRRTLRSPERSILLSLALILLGICVWAILWPRAASTVLALLSGWTGFLLLVKVWRYRAKRRE
jgi:cardiolipin synthase A/B